MLIHGSIVALSLSMSVSICRAIPFIEAFDIVQKVIRQALLYFRSEMKLEDQLLKGSNAYAA
jgi:hypothetical protein